MDYLILVYFFVFGSYLKPSIQRINFIINVFILYIFKKDPHYCESFNSSFSFSSLIKSLRAIIL